MRFSSTRLTLFLSGIILFFCTKCVLANKPVDWPTLNPAFKGATFVKDPKVCEGCHESALAHFQETVHPKAFKVSSPEGGACESCHGPRSQHVEKGGGTDLKLTPSAWNSVCLQCHQGGSRKHWQGSAHATADVNRTRDVNCTSCHTLMQKKSDRSLLSAPKEESVCYTCHINIRGEANKSSHHPILEGKITCSDCHLPHGSVNRTLLKGASVNETCYGCHQEKRGPFLWEHPPARENCMNCHEAHGSNNNKLQNSKDGFLCMQCHTYGGHINLPRYNRVSTLSGEGCVNCHMTIHGSNSPSGRKLTR